VAHAIDSPVSEEAIKRLFGELRERETAKLIATRRAILEALGLLLVKREPITMPSLAKNAKLKQSEVVKHADLWKHLADKNTEEAIVEAVRELQEAGEPVTRKKLAEKTGFSTGRLSRRRSLWAHAVEVVAPKSRGVIVEACEKLQQQNIAITIAEVARELGISQGCIASHKAILRTFAAYEDDPKIGKYAQGRVNASPSEIFRESVQRLLSPDMSEKKVGELNSTYSSLRWYEALSPTAQDRQWIGRQIVELKGELSRRKIAQKAVLR
jgi:hypothetical protein